MVVGKTGLDGTPRRWPTAGFPPLRSARLISLTPDRDLAEDIRKQLGKNILDPLVDLQPAQAGQLASLLGRAFGTPAGPRVRLPDWNEVVTVAVVRPDPSKGVFANLRQIARDLRRWKPAGVRSDWEAAAAAWAELKLDDATLARGSVLYRRLCVQCHGPTGAGDGRHAIAFAAMPRDYRQGIFKFVTTAPPPGQPRKGLGAVGKPRRDDLKRTLRAGIDGSMMPAFPSLSEGELDDLVSYVIHLAIRGETEFATLAKAMQPTEDDPEFSGPELAWLFEQNLIWVLYNWGVAARSAIPIPPEFVATPEERLESAFRGYVLYNSAEFGCAGCHSNYGREEQLKWDLWGGVVQPRNLVLGVYRGGRRGEDLYARLYGGIHPSGMPGFANTLASGPHYPNRPNKLWNIVHFLQALADPYARERLQDPAELARVKERLKAQGDLLLDDLTRVRIDP